jgi:cytoskeletal protein CcmA (bactofilin family)
MDIFMISDKNEQSDFSQEENKIALGAVLNGNIVSGGDFRIDGKLIGNLNIDGKVTIGKSGYIKGEVICQNACVEGSFEGMLQASKSLNLKSSAKISGNIIAGQLIIASGAVMNATCEMSGAVKTLESDRQSKKRK